MISVEYILPEVMTRCENFSGQSATTEPEIAERRNLKNNSHSQNQKRNPTTNDQLYDRTYSRLSTSMFVKNVFLPFKWYVDVSEEKESLKQKGIGMPHREVPALNRQLR